MVGTKGKGQTLKKGNPFRKPKRVSASPIDDIPEAIREGSHTHRSSYTKQVIWLWGAIAFSGIILLSSIGFAFLAQRSSTSRGTQTSADSIAKGPVGETASNPNAPPGTVLGHYPYEVAPTAELRPISADGGIRLRQVAAEKFRAMVDAAQADGVSLVPISGFRTLSDQQYLFFEVKAQRGQDARKRAEVSAPPGYSEHHTGYAVDIGDGNAPSADLNPYFEKTAAFQWLSANAAHFNFELSFPKNNSQGVSYEPWHWRFVGDRNSLETFYKARTATQK